MLFAFGAKVNFFPRTFGTGCKNLVKLKIKIMVACTFTKVVCLFLFE